MMGGNNNNNNSNNGIFKVSNVIQFTRRLLILLGGAFIVGIALLHQKVCIYHDEIDSLSQLVSSSSVLSSSSSSMTATTTTTTTNTIGFSNKLENTNNDNNNNNESTKNDVNSNNNNDNNNNNIDVVAAVDVVESSTLLKDKNDPMRRSSNGEDDNEKILSSSTITTTTTLAPNALVQLNDNNDVAILPQTSAPILQIDKTPIFVASLPSSGNGLLYDYLTCGGIPSSSIARTYVELPEGGGGVSGNNETQLERMEREQLFTKLNYQRDSRIIYDDYEDNNNTNTGSMKQSIGVCLEHNIYRMRNKVQKSTSTSQNQPIIKPFDFCGKQPTSDSNSIAPYNIYMDTGYVSNDKCFYPSLSYPSLSYGGLEALYESYPNMTIVLIKRNKENWYNNMLQSNTKSTLTKLKLCWLKKYNKFHPIADREKFSYFYEYHNNNVKKFALEHPSINYIEFSYGDPNLGQQLQSYFGINPNTCWKKSKKNVSKQIQHKTKTTTQDIDKVMKATAKSVLPASQGMLLSSNINTNNQIRGSSTTTTTTTTQQHLTTSTPALRSGGGGGGGTVEVAATTTTTTKSSVIDKIFYFNSATSSNPKFMTNWLTKTNIPFQRIDIDDSHNNFVTLCHKNVVCFIQSVVANAYKSLFDNNFLVQQQQQSNNNDNDNILIIPNDTFEIHNIQQFQMAIQNVPNEYNVIQINCDKSSSLGKRYTNQKRANSNWNNSKNNNCYLSDAILWRGNNLLLNTLQNQFGNLNGNLQQWHNDITKIPDMHCLPSMIQDQQQQQQSSSSHPILRPYCLDINN